MDLDWLFHPVQSLRKLQEQRRKAQLARLRSRYQVFRTLLDDNHRAVELITEAGSSLRSPVFWPEALRRIINELLKVTADLVEKLNTLADGAYQGLVKRQQVLAAAIREDLAKLPKQDLVPYCIFLDAIKPDMYRAVGGKSANLARLRQTGVFTVPNGFVIPVSMCRLFLDKDDLYLRIVARLRSGEDKDGLPDQESVEAVQKMILQAELPVELQKALRAANPSFSRGKGLAVRSSAISEDSASHSFAGQYASILNVVNSEQLEEAFKKVVASAFNPRNIAYRRHGGLPPYEFDLAVLCLEMVDVYSAGILFTRDPNYGASDNMLISAVYGVGELAVGGSEAADVYRPPRDGSGPGESQIAKKTHRLVISKEGGLVEQELDPEEAYTPVLTEDQIMEMVRLGLMAEEMLSGPQDIEWAVDVNGEIVILQSRPLKLSSSSGMSDMVRQDRKALVGPGLVSSPGMGAGEVRIINNDRDLEGLTDPPYVFVMHQSLVQAVSVLREAGAILVDLGNPADHLSCVAREYEVVMLTGLVDATKVLRNGDRVLVDGERAVVYEATEQEMEQWRKRHRKKAAVWRDRVPRPEDPLAAALYDRIVPLNLTDAYGPTFSIAECKSLHDLVRYAHEKAVLAMFEAGDEAIETTTGLVCNLESDIPFMVSIIDLGGGLVEGAGKRITPDQVLSRPFNALWQGVATPGLNWGPAGGVDISSVASRFLTDHRSARPVGMPNYALVTRDFLNLNARMDFHFTMVDSICGMDAKVNYIKFRFKGGGTGLEQRIRRVRCLSEILSSNGFFCNQRDDLLTAAIQGGAPEVIEEKLRVIGRLLGFSRLLDAVMRTDDMIPLVAEAFMDGDYNLESIKELLEASGDDETNKEGADGNVRDEGG